jgi:hypothetical protein
MNWAIQINWNGHWITVDQGYKTKDDAEWATAEWKQKNNCTGDPFRRVRLSSPQLVAVADPDVGGVMSDPPVGGEG